MPSPYTHYADLRNLLEKGASDVVICVAFDRLLVSMNCEMAAANYLAAVGFICHSRPHLAERLLRRPIDALIQLGAEDVNGVTWFVAHLVKEPDEYFVEWAGAEGIKWLREQFPQLTELLGPLFDECWLELEKRIRAIKGGQV